MAKLLINTPHCSRLKPRNTEKLLQEYGNRARKLEGEKLSLDDFAQYLDVPVSDMLRDMFALFDEVSTEGEIDFDCRHRIYITRHTQRCNMCTSFQGMHFVVSFRCIHP